MQLVVIVQAEYAMSGESSIALVSSDKRKATKVNSKSIIKEYKAVPSDIRVESAKVVLARLSSAVDETNTRYEAKKAEADAVLKEFEDVKVHKDEAVCNELLATQEHVRAKKARDDKVTEQADKRARHVQAQKWLVNLECKKHMDNLEADRLDALRNAAKWKAEMDKQKQLDTEAMAALSCELNKRQLPAADVTGSSSSSSSGTD